MSAMKPGDPERFAIICYNIIYCPYGPIMSAQNAIYYENQKVYDGLPIYVRENLGNKGHIPRFNKNIYWQMPPPQILMPVPQQQMMSNQQMVMGPPQKMVPRILPMRPIGRLPRMPMMKTMPMMAMLPQPVVQLNPQPDITSYSVEG